MAIEKCSKCGRERPDYICDPSCPSGGYCNWQERAAEFSGPCACGAFRSKSDPFVLTPNPMLPSRAGSYLLKATRHQETEQSTPMAFPHASDKNATRCTVRACRRCYALYASPDGKE